MRFVFKLSLLLVATIAPAALGQVNPNTNIRWPMPSCATPGAPYIPNDNVCATSTPSGALPVNNPQYTGTMQGPSGILTTFSASVNSQINVMAPPYNAKGDCTTDDTAAFTAAQVAAIGFATGNTLPAVLYLPKPPGGCYIVSDFFWKGVSIIGQPSGLGQASPKQYAITLKSKPGFDVFHQPDPSVNTYSATFYPGGALQDLAFLVDNSAPAVNGAHRWPGRWEDDGAMTSGSAVLKSPNAKFTCDDVGEPILVYGADVSGGNLSTTIQSVSPCWTPSTTSGAAGWQVVTLAAAASTTVTNAHLYVSILGLPVTTTIGPCGIAYDLKDGDSTHWLATLQGAYTGARLENVTFASTNGNSNNVCGIYNQGNSTLYAWTVTDFMFAGLTFGQVSSTTELNSVKQPGSGDFEKWNHGIFSSVKYPFINVNGLSNSMRNIQYAPVQAGIQLVQSSNVEFDIAAGWEIDLGMESNASWTNYGHRIEGEGHALYGDFTGGQAGMVGYLGCVQCTVFGTPTNTQINGWGNTIVSPNHIGSLTDNSGYANKAKWIYNGGGSPGGLPLPYYVTGLFSKGSSDLAGRFTSDFVHDGNYTTPYNWDDQLIMPYDLVVSYTAGFPYTTYFLPDTAAKSGVALIVSGTSPTSDYYALMQYNELGGSNPASIVIGTNAPATGGTFYFSARCGSSTTFNIYLRAAVTVNQSFACTTSYQQYAVPMVFSGSDVGQPLQWGGQAGTPVFYMEWASFVPWKTTVLKGATASIGGSALTAGQCSSGTVTIQGIGTSSGLVAKTTPATYPGDGFIWESYISAANTATVKVCAIVAGTPTASVYNVRIEP
jgi:hypothetical protein